METCTTSASSATMPPSSRFATQGSLESLTYLELTLYYGKETPRLEQITYGVD